MLPLLVVDDSNSDLQLAQRELLRANVLNPVFLLPSAEECLSYFRGESDYPEPRVPCIALIDLVMAPLSGLDLLKELRRVPRAAQSVMIMLSGVSEFKMIAEGYALGAVTFIVKPISAADIVQTLSAVPKISVLKRAQGYELGIPPGLTGSIQVPSTVPAPPGVGR